MNRGLLAKAWRESWLLTLLFGLGLALVEGLLSYAIPRFQEQLSALWSRLTFIQSIMQALVGTERAGPLGPEMIGAIVWVHPAVLALVWGHAITFCTRVPVGEIDRGTIDVLLSLPVSRWQLYGTETVVWLASGIAVVLFGAMGTVGGRLTLAGTMPIEIPKLAILTFNLFALYLAVGGLAWCASASGDRRGRVIAVVFAFLIGSLLLNYLANFWRLAEHLSFLGVLHYYRPIPILRDGVWPMRDIAVLLASGTALWGLGGMIFSRRDLRTV
ncbi:MAG: ABC transporter permease subunit [Verrucomicrobia bacterium]|nr:ABC transporter permease subunit [Verrucomicrobiota bacterium]